MEINKYFKEQYLTAGRTCDNYILENCPDDFLILAEDFLSKSDNGVKPCNIKLSSAEQAEIERVLLNCEYVFQEPMIASYYLTTLVMAKLFKGINESQYKLLQSQLQSFKENDYKQIVQNYLNGGYMHFDVAKQAENLGQKIELNIFLFNIGNKVLQQAINNFISCREPYSVKIFTNADTLATYYDPNGNIIQTPHDYMSVDVNEFIIAENNPENEI